MSLFRNENPNLGATTSVQELSGYGAGTPVVNNYKPTTREMLDFQLSAVLNPTGSLTGWVYEAPWKCQVIAIRINSAVVSSASVTLDIQKVTADGTAPGSGTTLLSSTVNLHTTITANTRLELSPASGLTTTAASLVLNAGDQICYSISATPTALVGCNVQIEIVQIG